MSPDPLTLAAAEQARNVALQMMSERGRGLVLVGAARLGLIEPPIEQALHATRSVRNDFAHSAGDPTLTEPRHQKRLQRVYPEAECSPLWQALAPLLQRQSARTGVHPAGHDPGGVHRGLRATPDALLSTGDGAIPEPLNGRSVLDRSGWSLNYWPWEASNRPNGSANGSPPGAAANLKCPGSFCPPCPGAPSPATPAATNA
jgi:hypothetical protein